MSCVGALQVDVGIAWWDSNGRGARRVREGDLHHHDFRFHSLEAVLSVVLMLGHGRADVAEMQFVVLFQVLTPLVHQALRLIHDLLRLC